MASFLGKYKLAIIILLAFVFRIISINQSFWLDEATTGLVSQMTVGQYLSELAPKDFHPPMYYFIAISWANIFGNSEVSLRAISVLASLITVLVVYKIGERIGNKRIATVSALLFATSGLSIYYSQEARMYSLACTFVALSVYGFLTLREKFTPLFGLSLLFSFLSHYLTIFILPVFWLCFLFGEKPTAYTKRFLVSHAMLVPGLLWIPVFVEQFSQGAEIESTQPLWANILGKTSVKEIILVPAKFLYGRISVDNNTVYVLLILAGVLLIAYIATTSFNFQKTRQWVNSQKRLILFWLFAPFVLSAVMGLFIPVFGYFRLLFILPAFYLLIAVGLDSFDLHKFKILFTAMLVINLVTSGVYLFNPKFHREDWRGMQEYVHQNSEESAIVIFPASSQHEAYNYYLMRHKAVGDVIVRVLDSETIDSVDNQEVVWLVRYVQPIFDPQDLTRRAIEQSDYQKVNEHDFNGVVVWEYTKENENSN